MVGRDVWLVSFFFGFAACSVRVKDNIYVRISDTEAACFRLLNGTHQTGCQSSSQGNTGVAQLIRDHSNVEYIKRDRGNHAPFVAIMRLEMFKNVSLLNELYSSGKVNGILILHDPIYFTKPEKFSEDTSCPNDLTSLYGNDEKYGHCQQTKWNPDANSLRFTNWDIPIFYIQNGIEIDFIENKCYKLCNEPVDGQPRQWPLCAIEMTMFNLAAGNSEICLRRNDLFSGLEGTNKNCDALEDKNLHAFLPSTTKDEPLEPGSVFVLAARMDSFGFFSAVNPGAHTSLSNVLAMLSIAEAIGRNFSAMFNNSSSKIRRLFFVLFNGESLDYIGSSRMVWDMTNNRFPMPLDDSTSNQSALFNTTHIGFYLELNQLISVNDKFYLHVDPVSLKKNPLTKSVVDKAIKAIVAASDGLLVTPVADQPLPPASFQSFLKINESIPGFVITDHKSAFTNKYYNSFLDDSLSFDEEDALTAIGKLANVVLKFVANFTNQGSQETKDLTVDKNFLNTLSTCFWTWPGGWNCSLFESIVGIVVPDRKRRIAGSNFKNAPSQRTYMGYHSSQVSVFSNYILAYVLGERTNWTGEENKKCGEMSNQVKTAYLMPDLMNLNDSANTLYCVVSPVQMTVAKSPAFEIDGYDFSSGVYSTWAESVWNTPSLRMFMKPNPAWEVGVFAAGIAVFVISLSLGYVLHKGSETLFASNIVAL